MPSTRIADHVRAEIEPIVANLDYELVEVEYRKEGGRWILRLYIDQPEGISLDDCERVSRAVEPVLDRSDLIPHRYFLEVSSPGLDRPLKKPSDYERFAGRNISLKTFTPVHGRRNFRGQLAGVTGDAVTILATNGENLAIPLANVAAARLEAEV